MIVYLSMTRGKAEPRASLTPPPENRAWGLIWELHIESLRDLTIFVVGREDSLKVETDRFIEPD